MASVEEGNELAEDGSAEEMSPDSALEEASWGEQESNSHRDPSADEVPGSAGEEGLSADLESASGQAAAVQMKALPT